MSATVGYHPLVQKDLIEIPECYETEAGLEVADRVETEFRLAITAIRNGPRHFAFYQKQRRYRRCHLATFPHVILFRQAGSHVRIMVLKHVNRAPAFGLSCR